MWIVAIGVSTGGPKLLNEVISKLDVKTSVCYLIACHMPLGHTKELATRLNAMTKLCVKEGVDGEYLKEGTVYLAPGGYHLQIVGDKRLQIQLEYKMLGERYKPSIDLMFLSLARVKSCHKIIAVIMTGIGCDGLRGATELKKITSCFIIAQDKASSTVFGMPKAIIDAGLADYIVSGKDIAKKIKEIVGG